MSGSDKTTLGDIQDNQEKWLSFLQHVIPIVANLTYIKRWAELDFDDKPIFLCKTE